MENSTIRLEACSPLLDSMAQQALVGPVLALQGLKGQDLASLSLTAQDLAPVDLSARHLRQKRQGLQAPLIIAWWGCCWPQNYPAR